MSNIIDIKMEEVKEKGAHLPEGTFLQGGKYRIVRFIGSGGFGCTYEAEHTELKEKVAIKEFFVKDFCNRDEETSSITVGTESKKPLVEKLLNKFKDEARSLYRLRHPGIVSVSDVFEENGTAYYVMDYIEGHSLQDIVKAEGRLTEERSLKYIREVSEALSYVHSHNRLHLDIKPGNIMIDGNDNAILIDFGASKQYDEASGENTSTLMGRTPGYAPPEQMSNKVGKFLPATDIYALGATLYKCLSGETPPDSTDLISGEELVPLPSTVHDSTRRAVSAAMELNKGRRPQSVKEFLAILDGPSERGVGQEAEEKTEYAASGTSGHTGGETTETEYPSQSSESAGHASVDLGLSVRWATCNLGAQAPSEHGDYYSWGETAPKMSYGEYDSMTSGKDIGDVSGDKGHDAAREKLGGDWRLPTEKEMEELETRCRWHSTSREGVVGYVVTGPSGSSIFLPSSGLRIGDSVEGRGTVCSYWSSTPSESDKKSAYCLTYSKNNVGHVRYRYHGLPIRPVIGDGNTSVGGADTGDLESLKQVRQELKATIARIFTRTWKWLVLAVFVLAGVVVGFLSFRSCSGSGGTSSAGMRDSTEVVGMADDSLEAEKAKADSIKRREFFMHKRDSIRRLEAELRARGEAARIEAEKSAAELKRMQDSIEKADRERAAFEERKRIEQAQKEEAEQKLKEAARSRRGEENGHEWIDIGLSVKWATCNVGAASPSDYGQYYAWGETATKSRYNQVNSKTTGLDIDDINGERRYDAASYNWGGSWRLPTKDEMKELVEKCRWEWTTQSGHTGYSVTGPNGASIFLPTAGWRDGTSRYGAGGSGRYWTSSPYGSSTDYSFTLVFSSGRFYVDWYSRYYGFSVRPVKN